MSDNDPQSLVVESSKKKRSVIEQIPLWVGVIGSVITITLTIWNTHTKSEIDKRAANLQELEVKLKERTTGLEESRERVDRYKWVLGLFPDLNEKDEKKKNFTIGLVRLALTKEEAEQLFAGLQNSSDKELQSLGPKRYRSRAKRIDWYSSISNEWCFG